MKIAIVPAQVTTVEDKVAGNLNLSQLILLVAPVFGSGVLYTVMPPSFGMVFYKVVIISLLFIIIVPLAINIRGRLLINWLIILARYNVRPRYYVFNKNSFYLRNSEAHFPPKNAIKKVVADVSQSVRHNAPPVSIHDKARLEAMMADPHAKLAFKISRKGGLDVHITEVK